MAEVLELAVTDLPSTVVDLSAYFNLFVLNVQYFQSRIRRVTEAGQRKSAAIMDFLKERFEHVKLIQLYNGHSHEQSILGRHMGSLIDVNMEATVYSATVQAISTVQVSATPLLVFGWGGCQVMEGTMTLGALNHIG